MLFKLIRTIKYRFSEDYEIEQAVKYERKVDAAIARALRAQGD
jgi:hypothetical protein